MRLEVDELDPATGKPAHPVMKDVTPFPSTFALNYTGRLTPFGNTRVVGRWRPVACTGVRRKLHQMINVDTGLPLAVVVREAPHLKKPGTLVRLVDVSGRKGEAAGLGRGMEEGREGVVACTVCERFKGRAWDGASDRNPCILRCASTPASPCFLPSAHPPPPLQPLHNR